ncbi:MAG: hypothetical protein ACRCYP_04815 [Alphaproteobacteria bacterium]
MQKKITSSLVIAAYCLNSLPIFAGPLAPFSSGVASGSTEIAWGAGLPSARFNSSSLGEKEENVRKISRMLEQSQKVAEKNGWGEPGEQKRSNRVSRDTDNYACVNLLNDFPHEGSPKTIISYFGERKLDSQRTLLQAKKSSKEVSSCFATSDIGTLSVEMSRSEIYKKITAYLQKFDFGKKIELKDLDRGASYSYVRFFPDFDTHADANVVESLESCDKMICAEYGETDLDYSNFLKRAHTLQALSYPILFSSLNTNNTDKEWEFFVSPGGDDYIALGNIPYHNGDSFLNIDTLRKFSLMDYANANSSYVKSFFGDSIFTSPTEHLYGPGLDVTINPFTNSGKSSSPSLNEAKKYDDEVAPTQASHAASNSHLSYYIGTGALAAVFSVFGGAAVYHWWKAKKRNGRNERYDAVMYKKTPDDSEIIVPAAQL